MQKGMMWSLKDAVASAGGLLQGEDVIFNGVFTDTRMPTEGRLFIALKGENHDGHDYLATAVAQGALAVMVDHEVEVSVPQWIVKDTRQGLAKLAAAWRNKLNAKVVAITGSNGKTTVKEMVTAILSQAASTIATAGNLNNEIGLPLTLLNARDEKFLVLEMGASHPHEISFLTHIARPHIAVITSIGRAHLEGFGSLEGIARAKGEIVEGLESNGVCVIPADSPWQDLWYSLLPEKSFRRFGWETDADISADPATVSMGWSEDGCYTRFVVREKDREYPLNLKFLGRQNVTNALAAITVARQLQIGWNEIQAGLGAVKPVHGRLYPQLVSGIALIDDSYNANPDSIAAAVEVLAHLDGRRWLVLGDLAELGPTSEVLHRHIGTLVKEAGIEKLVTTGHLSKLASESFGSGALNFASKAELISYLRENLRGEDRVLVKGSHSARMDEVVNALIHMEDGRCFS